MTPHDKLKRMRADAEAEIQAAINEQQAERLNDAFAVYWNLKEASSVGDWQERRLRTSQARASEAKRNRESGNGIGA